MMMMTIIMAMIMMIMMIMVINTMTIMAMIMILKMMIITMVKVMMVLKIKPPSKYFCKACFDLRLIENNAARMALEFGNNLGNAAQVGLFPNIGTGLTLEFVERIFHIS